MINHQSQKQTRLSSQVTQRNGVLNQVNCYLNTLGSWSTYRDLSRPEDIPKRLADITTAFFGVAGLGSNGWPKLTGILGAIMAVHALEQVTGAAITFGTRLLVRGKPLGQYRGVILRQSPFTPRAARALGWLIGSRLVEADGYYFFESGRTWHSQSLTVHIGDTTKTLTHVRSFSLPYREYYFDREVSPQTVVDVVKGDRAPNTIPGFIGSVNELENITSLGYIKRAFIAANWLLIDEGERDDGGPGSVDYDALVNGKPPDGGGGLAGGRPYHSPLSPSGSGGYQAGAHKHRQDNNWPSTTNRGGDSPGGLNSTVAARNGTSKPIPLRPIQEPVATSASSNTPPPPDEPYLRIKARYQAPNGRLYPMLIQGIATNPVTMVKKANAIYYDDDDTRRWRQIVDDDTRVALAREVEAGNLKITADWQHLL